jgi:hypothetical protein
VLAWPLAAVGQPVPLWHNTLEDNASSTIDGGVLQGSAPVYTPGIVTPPLTTVNKFESTGSSNVFWGTTQVQNIFTGWSDPDGVTVDLYFSGIDGSTHSGDSGLWSVGHRVNDNFLLIGVRDDSIRINFRNDSGPDAGNTRSFQTGNLNLDPDETYRLTLRQHSSLGDGGDVELYLDDLGGAVYSNAAPILIGDLQDSPPYVWNFPLEAGSGPALGMSIGDRHPFAGADTSLRDGEAVDEVRIFNASYSPADLDIPEPATALLLALTLPLLARRRRATNR